MKLRIGLREIAAAIFLIAIVLFLWLTMRNSNPIQLDGRTVERVELEESMTGKTMELSDEESIQLICTALPSFYMSWDLFPAPVGGSTSYLRLYTADGDMLEMGLSGTLFSYEGRRYTIHGHREELNALLALWEPLLPEGMSNTLS